MKAFFHHFTPFWGFPLNLLYTSNKRANGSEQKYSYYLYSMKQLIIITII